MVRGFLSGIVLGGAVGAAGLTLVSLVSEAPLSHALVSELAEAVPEVPVVVAEPAVPVVVPVPDVVPAEELTEEQVAPLVPDSPAPPVLPAAPTAEQTAPQQTAPQQTVPDQTVPDQTVIALGDAPAAIAQGAAPQALDVPGSETSPSPAEIPAAPVVVADGEAPLLPAAPMVKEVPPEPATGLDDGPTLPTLAVLPAAPGAEAAPGGSDLPPLPPLTAEEEALLKRLGDGSADAQPEVTDPAPKSEGAVEPEPAPEGMPEPESTVEPAPVDPVPAPNLAPAPGLPKEVAGVTVNRLPRIGQAPVAEATEVAVDANPMVQFARAFDNPTQKPLFAVILMDTGAADLDRAALARLPFPVSFAIDPLDPLAADYAAIYRAGGQEVLMQATGIPDGAQAQDLEVAFGVMATGLPESVAVIDTEEGRFQGNRLLAGLVVPLVASQGRGMVTWDRGLNAADQVARREGLPATVAFRALDAEGETTPVIRRYLDRAAFKAAQEGQVTVIGTTRPETVAALLEWAVEGRSATVALAPVTAVLTTD